MKNSYSYKFTPKANSDLISILDYIDFQLLNPKAGYDFTVKLFKSIDVVCEFPNSSRKVDNDFIIDKNVRKFFVDNYIVFYTVDEESKTVIVLRIVFGKRNIEEILKML